MFVCPEFLFRSSGLQLHFLVLLQINSLHFQMSDSSDSSTASDSSMDVGDYLLAVFVCPEFLFRSSGIH